MTTIDYSFKYNGYHYSLNNKNKKKTFGRFIQNKKIE